MSWTYCLFWPSACEIKMVLFDGSSDKGLVQTLFYHNSWISAIKKADWMWVLKLCVVSFFYEWKTNCFGHSRCCCCCCWCRRCCCCYRHCCCCCGVVVDVVAVVILASVVVVVVVAAADDWAQFFSSFEVLGLGLTKLFVHWPIEPKDYTYC